MPTRGSILRIGACGLCLLSLVASRQALATTVLDPAARQPLQRELKGGEVHAFEITLEADQYLQLLVGQQGVDVVVTLLDPGEQLLLKVDNPSGADGSYGPERVVWVAQSSGSYGLTVSAWGGNGAAGRYEVTLEEVRPATTMDRKRAAAERALAEADGLYWQGKRESQEQAIGQYEKALEGFLALGDRSRQADIFFRLGQAREAIGEWAQAKQAYEQAWELYVAFENERQQAITLHNSCVVYHTLDEIEEGLGHCSRALLLWERVDDRRGKALTLNLLGVLYRLRGERHRALAFYDQALELWRELKNRSEEANTLHNRGRLYSLLGKRDQALTDLHEALAIYRNLGQRRSTIVPLNSLGQVYAKWQEMGKAAEFYRQALELQDADGGSREARTLIGIGLCYFASDEKDKALELFQQAREISSTHGDRAWEAEALFSIGRLFNSPQQLKGARDLFAAIRDRHGEAKTLLAIASAERARPHGSLQVARKEIEKALGLIEDLRIRASANRDLRAYYFATKQSYYEFYIDLLMELHRRRPGAGHNGEALAASERARARSLLDLLTAAGGDLSRTGDPGLLERVQNLERRINTIEHQLIGLLENDTTQRDLVEKLETEQRDLLREYELALGEIRDMSPGYAAQPLSAPELQRRVVDEETLLLEYKLAEKRSFLWAVTPEAVISFELPGRGEIEAIARRAYDLITRNQRRQRQRASKDLARLSDLLLGPVATQLRGKKRLLIVSEGALQYLPFGALNVPGIGEPGQEPGGPLIAEYAVVTMPSASALAVLRDRLAKQKPAPKTLVVLADPVFGREDPRFENLRTWPVRAASRPASGKPAERSSEMGPYPRLIYSAREAENIVSLVSPDNGLKVSDFDANRDLVRRGELKNYRIVHFATHGDLNARHPELSRLVLSLIDEQGRPRDDGLLHAYELYNLEIPAELVVLSACQTALGTQVEGEGLLGLTRGFMHAGAARVVVSLWNVNDRATAELMRRFYRGLLNRGLPPAEALRAAQDSIRREPAWRSPYYWAGFVLQGEWRDIYRQPD